MSQEKKVRNEALYNDFKTGLSVVDLVAKYRIDSSVVTRIIKREQLKDEVLPLVGDQNKN
jgi:Mor family transcriptional regulator